MRKLPTKSFSLKVGSKGGLVRKCVFNFLYSCILGEVGQYDTKVAGLQVTCAVGEPVLD
jgi:hypothetical protein